MTFGLMSRLNSDKFRRLKEKFEKVLTIRVLWCITNQFTQIYAHPHPEDDDVDRW
jgi:hypothetical protein